MSSYLLGKSITLSSAFSQQPLGFPQLLFEPSGLGWFCFLFRTIVRMMFCPIRYNLVLTVLVIVICVINGFKHSSISRATGRISSKKLNMAGGQVPMVPYYPDKASKDYQWMDIYNALGDHYLRYYNSNIITTNSLSVFNQTTIFWSISINLSFQVVHGHYL